jgi:hypothetical protein
VLRANPAGDRKNPRRSRLEPRETEKAPLRHAVNQGALKPICVTVRSSSRAAADGSATGSIAKTGEASWIAADRFGFLVIYTNSLRFAGRCCAICSPAEFADRKELQASPISTSTCLLR